VGRWLGVDAGAARVGLALSDPDGMLAMPLRTVERTGVSDDAVAGEIAEEVRRGDVSRVIVGLPLHLNGAEGAAAQAARALAGAIKAHLGDGVPVRFQDERGSTVQAHDMLHQAGRRAKRHRGVVDQVAAVVILQAALDNKKVHSGELDGEVRL
jgi:putative Holliday junction resolvase